MRKHDFSKIIKLSVIFVLIAAMALCMVSCGGTKKEDDEENSKTPVEVTISVTVIDDKKNSDTFEITTKSENLGDALLESGRVKGDNDKFGLYIKEVDGLRADFELDGAYWSVSKDSKMLVTGPSQTPIADGDKFELTYTK